VVAGRNSSAAALSRASCPMARSSRAAPGPVCCAAKWTPGRRPARAGSGPGRGARFACRESTPLDTGSERRGSST